MSLGVYLYEYILYPYGETHRQTLYLLSSYNGFVYGLIRPWTMIDPLMPLPTLFIHRKKGNTFQSSF